MNDLNWKYSSADNYINELTTEKEIQKAILLKSLTQNDEAFFLALNIDKEQLCNAKYRSNRRKNRKFDDIGVTAKDLSSFIQTSNTAN